jgi:hypothetical protein
MLHSSAGEYCVFNWKFQEREGAEESYRRHDAEHTSDLPYKVADGET